MVASGNGMRRGLDKAPALGGTLGLAAAATRALWKASPLVAAAAAGVGVAGWGASQILITPSRGLWRLHRPLRVVDVDRDNGRITLAGPDAAIPGVWGLKWADGYAQVDGPPAGYHDDSEEPTVMRTFRMLQGSAPPARGAMVEWDALAWPDRAEAIGLPVRFVPVRGPVCELPAWLYPAQDSGQGGEDWAIFVHGRKSRRGQAFRSLRPMHAAGWNCMTISYRNDDWLPRTGTYGLGSTEWEDLEAAVRTAEQRGAKRIVLVGYSLGGAIVSTFLRRSPHADRVVGVVLDSPVLDWQTVLRRLARNNGLPEFLANAAMVATTLRTGIDFGDLNNLDHAAEFTQPTLLFHGTADEQVPVEVSRAFASAREGVTYVEVADAAHVVSWNHEPERYEQALRDFLAELSPPARRRGRLPFSAHLPHRRGGSDPRRPSAPPVAAG